MPNPAAASQARPRVVFFGSGPVAAASLQLLTEWCDIEAVITKPQPPHHKDIFPVIAVAERHKLPLLYAGNRQELDAVMSAQHFTSRLAVLIDYGIIVSQQVIDCFELGIVNSHFSLLPEWRGADPISFAILSGQPQTGVSLMLLVQAMDEGPLLSQGVFELPPDITTPLLTAQLIKLSDALLRHSLPAYLSGEPLPTTGKPLVPVSQQDAMQALGKPYEPTYSRKLSKADSQLDFTKSAAQLEREVRAFIEWPKSRTTLAGKEVVITRAHVASDGDALPENHAQHPVGQAYATLNKTIAINTGDGVLVIDELKPAGKGAMSAEGFLAGNSLT